MTLSELVEQLKNDMAEVRRRAVHELSKIPAANEVPNNSEEGPHSSKETD